MAEQITQDVVKEAQSVGDHSPTDGSAKPSKLTSAGDGEAPTLANTTEFQTTSNNEPLSSASNPDVQVDASDTASDVSGREANGFVHISGSADSLAGSI